MNKKILIAGFTCLSAFAVAQLGGDKSASTAKDQHPREVASGQATGKTTIQPAGSSATVNSGSQVTAPRDLATGQASGKRQYQPIIIRKVSEEDSVSAREQATGKATGKTMAQDDWHATSKTSNGNAAADVNMDGAATVRESPSLPSKGKTRVAAGDVNGDGEADVSVHSGSSDVKSPRDLATGQASGKRQHEPVTVTKEAGAAAPQKQ